MDIPQCADPLWRREIKSTLLFLFLQQLHSDKPGLRQPPKGTRLLTFTPSKLNPSATNIQLNSVFLSRNILTLHLHDTQLYPALRAFAPSIIPPTTQNRLHTSQVTSLSITTRFTSRRLKPIGGTRYTEFYDTKELGAATTQLGARENLANPTQQTIQLPNAGNQTHNQHSERS